MHVWGDKMRAKFESLFLEDCAKGIVLVLDSTYTKRKWHDPQSICEGGDRTMYRIVLNLATETCRIKSTRSSELYLAYHCEVRLDTNITQYLDLAC